LADTNSTGCKKQWWSESVQKEHGSIERCGQDLADSNCKRKLQPERSIKEIRERISNCGQKISDSNKQHDDNRGSGTGEASQLETPEISISEQWAVEPELGRVAHGVAHRVDRLGAIGNGQVPQVAATAWETLIMPSMPKPIDKKICGTCKFLGWKSRPDGPWGYCKLLEEHFPEGGKTPYFRTCERWER
jgi:hypothetical protein